MTRSDKLHRCDLFERACTGVRLQVDYGKDETALVYLWQVRAASS